MADSSRTFRPHTWLGSPHRAATYVGRPLARFLDIEASGGILLVIATVSALVWANMWPESYESFWHTEVLIGVGNYVLEEGHLTLQVFVNDALMTIFFFVVGLEIKRELVVGDLRDPRVAALPAIAALGGMVVPAAIFLALNAGGDGQAGWGIPMATDIAFAVGVLALLGSRVPSELKLFLLALAIVDDIGAILVIALFYTRDLDPIWLVVAAGLLAVMMGMRRARVWSIPAYVIVGTLVWLAMIESGAHATIAGVLMGLIAPARPLMSDPQAEEIADTLEGQDDITATEVREVAFRVQESVSIAERLENVLHPWTSYVIVPIFALANTGLILSRESIEQAASSPVTAGIVLGLVVGKLVGITGFSLLATRIGVASLPAGVRPRQIAGVALVAGIGFTVSLFVTELAFEAEGLQDDAKIGILVASIVAAVAGAAVLGLGASSAPPPDDA